jgi:hypothetical protein
MHLWIKFEEKICHTFLTTTCVFYSENVTKQNRTEWFILFNRFHGVVIFPTKRYIPCFLSMNG